MEGVGGGIIEIGIFHNALQKVGPLSLQETFPRNIFLKRKEKRYPILPTQNNFLNIFAGFTLHIKLQINAILICLRKMKAFCLADWILKEIIINER